MAKRLRVATSMRSKPDVDVKRPMEITPIQPVRAQPSYGSIGLGIRPQVEHRVSSANTKWPQVEHRVTSASTRRPRTGRVPTQDALWIIERKASESTDTRNFS
ncbi:hypothetical protein LPJ77_003828 [Coemansia sp. RSA 2523]|nr:hypothetical protein LPJ54_006090 [Coemansia sp. RSA 1824]KAJ1775799.1 hypothetical protein LPJ54_003484 [Coemansia sp. RSA 1824]KAJ1800525.1 hypothetical protein LPJ77_006139 [Coemansia sp. RSA 2523]KAJ1806095.1 hypothetical protein LPJ77_003828 [Coemansia sp. RSA 2523]